MNTYSFGRHQSKINANQTVSAETQAHLDELDISRVGLGPGELALSEWAELGLELPDIESIRHYRLARIREQLRKFDYAGIVVSDPLNVRYATDSSNMQVWTMHNNVRYCFIATDGPVVLFDFKRVEHLSKNLSLIDEIRPAKMWSYLIAGDRSEQVAKEWAAELVDLVQKHGAGNTRLAMDRVNPEGLWVLQELGVTLHNGEEVMEHARVIKSDEEIKAMRCAVAACEASIGVMHSALEPGLSEQELWSYLHAENIKRGGEWLETAAA